MLVQFLYLDPARAVNNPFFVYRDTYMRDTFLSFVGKENEVTRLNLLYPLHGLSLLRLLRGIAGKRLTEKAHYHLREA